MFRTLACFSVLILLSCPVQAQPNTRRGAGVGAITGAVIGSVIGNQNDETAEGALIGGAVGAIAGGVIGRERDVQDYRAWQYHQSQQVAQQHAYARASSLADVATMARSGLSDQVIVNHIRSRGVQQELSVSDIVWLHQQGVSEYVIGAMQQSVGPRHSVAAVPVTPALPPPVVVRQYYHVNPPYVARGHCGHVHVRGHW